MSLVELMIAITVGLILVLGITTLIVQQSSTRTELEKSSRQIENGRYAAQLLSDDIQLAGYYGEIYTLPAAPTTLPAPCNTTVANFTAALPMQLQAYDAPASVPAAFTSSCLVTANHVTGTDILVIRRADTVSIPLASAVAGQVYMQTGIDPATSELTHIFGTGSDTSVFTLTTKTGAAAALRKFLVHIYYVSPCNTMSGTTCSSTDDSGNPIPTLKRMELALDPASGAMAYTSVPLVEGIENLQFDYGVDTDSDGAPDGSYLTVPAAVTDWPNVMSVRINILARNNDPTPGYTDPKTYNLGAAGTVGPFTEPAVAHYKRHVFSQVVRVVNPSGRRE